MSLTGHTVNGYVLLLCGFESRLCSLLAPESEPNVPSALSRERAFYAMMTMEFSKFAFSECKFWVYSGIVFSYE